MALILFFLAVVSCAVGSIEAAGQKSEQYCSDTYSKTFSLDNPSTLIEEFYFVGAVAYTDGNKKIKWKCSGILISEKYVLTAAHCLDSKELPTQVKFGLTSQYTPNYKDVTQTINISRLIKHPDYNRTSNYNDVALIELQQPIEITKHVKPICLEVEKKSSYSFLMTTNLGIRRLLQEQRNKLKRFNFREYSISECNEHYPQVVISKDSMICAGNEKEDPCLESGIPLVTVDQTYGYRVVGVAIFGKNCGSVNVPTVFNRVAYYIDWIESIVWP